MPELTYISLKPPRNFCFLMNKLFSLIFFYRRNYYFKEFADFVTKMKDQLAKLSHPPRLTKSRNIGKINNCFTVIKFQQVDIHHP